ncbi:MAG: DNA primase [Alphaproteobacteria bacterium]|nr:DNA primase [Alphaproteobacteria bacterium]
MAFPPAFLEELKNRVPLTQVVGKRVRLQRDGKEQKGLCPFHNEKTPSFRVNDQKGVFHCFGCGAGGNVFDFLTRAEGMAFLEAVKHLADLAGMALPDPDPESEAREKRRKTIGEAMEAAALWFVAQLATQAGERGRDYLAGRGLGREALARFRLGYAPDSFDALGPALVRQGFAEDLLIEAGLRRARESDNKPFDFFRNRVIFPVADRRGRVVAFGARALGDDKPKYINSPETPLFQKSRTLYQLHHAREAAAKGQALIVAEGYMDVIALALAGFEGAVAPLGTALTEDHLVELWRLAPEPVICLDGDAAGQAAQARTAERALPLLRPGQSLRFAVLPSGQDPDSLIRAQGPEAMRACLDAATPLSQVLWRIALGERAPDTPEQKAMVRARLRDMVGRIGDEGVRRFYGDEFRRRVDEELYSARRPFDARPTMGPRRPAFRQGPRGLMRPPPQTAWQAPIREMPAPEAAQERTLVLALINHPFLIAESAERLADLSLQNKELDAIRRTLLDLAAGRADTATALDKAAVNAHVIASGQAEVLDRLVQARVEHTHSWIKPEARPETVRENFGNALTHYRDRRMRPAELEAERNRFAAEPTAQNFERLAALTPAGNGGEDGNT